MAQAPQGTGQQGILDRIFARFQAKRGVPANSQNPTQNTQNIQQNSQNSQSTQQTQPSSSSDPNSLFAGLFEDRSPDASKQPPKFTLSRDKITEAANKQDFTADMPEELRQAFSSPEGFTLENISALVNHVGRAAYGRALEHGTALTGHFVESRISHESQNVPEHIRRHLATSRATSRVEDPVAKEHLTFIAKRISERFPDATEEDIADMSNEYFMQMARTIQPDAFNQQNQSQNPRFDPTNPDVQDYDSYLQGTKTLDQARQPMQSPRSGG